jgi:hypothetical protein
LSTALGYNTAIEIWKIGGDFGSMAMKRFYYRIWLPFTATKKRILILAIASYIAMC